MRITGGSNAEIVSATKSNFISNSKEKSNAQGSDTLTIQSSNESTKASNLVDNTDETKAKVIEAVNKMNEMLEVNHNTSKFQYHEGLDRYYVTIVDKETEEVVKEVPARKLLDAFYEMQKMLGMIVDEKI